jgi:hypothetical protein
LLHSPLCASPLPLYCLFSSQLNQTKQGEKRSIALKHFSNYFHKVQIANRADYETFIAHLYHLAKNIGIVAASRALGIPEERGKKIAQRKGFNIGRIVQRGRLPLQSLKSPDAIEATENVIRHYGDRAKIGATIAGAKALEHLADADAVKLVTPAASIAADQWTKAVDRAAGWTQARQQGVNVGVAVNVQLPTDEERAERRAGHAKLDEIARLLRANSAPSA